MEAKTKRNKTGIDTTGWDTCLYNDMEYMVPATNGMLEHRFAALMVDIGKGGVVNTYDNSNYLLLPRGKEKSHFSYLVDGIDHDFQAEGNHPIHLAIYQVGNPIPVAYQMIEPDKYNMDGTNKDFTVKAGEYFIYMGNAIPCDSCAKLMKHVGNGFVYPFKVYRNGVEMTHPEIDFADVDSNLNLIVKFKKGINLKNDLLTCTCYDESYRVVAHSKEMQVTNKNGKLVILPMKTSEWWLDGTYHIVVSHNKVPYSLIRFEWQNGTSVSFSQMDLPSDSPYMALQSYVCKYGKESAFIKLTGCRTMKMKALMERGKYDHLSSRNYWIESSYCMDVNFVQTLFRVVFEESNIHFIDCNEILKGWHEEGELYGLDLNLELFDVVALYNLSAILDSGTKLLNCLHCYLDIETNSSTILFGTAEELNRLVNVSEEWERFVPYENRWKMEPYTVNEQIRVAENFLSSRNISVPIDTKEVLIRTMRENKDVMKAWRRAEVENWLATDIVGNMKRRIMDQDFINGKLCCTLDSDDIFRSKIYPTESVTTSDFEETMSDLEDLVGLDSIKRHLKRLFRQMAFQQKRAKLGLKNFKEVLPHMIFTGNPGTGKTTVARMVGKIFKDLGMLKEGKVITADRSTLVGRYIGETEQKVTELLNSAHGNVLFIDEAYSLCDNDKGDRKDFVVVYWNACCLYWPTPTMIFLSSWPVMKRK